MGWRGTAVAWWCGASFVAAVERLLPDMQYTAVVVVLGFLAVGLVLAWLAETLVERRHRRRDLIDEGMGRKVARYER